MEAEDELDGVDDEVEEAANGAASDGCFSADFCGWRRGSLRATRGSTGFSAGKGGGAEPSVDTGTAGVGRGGDGV